MNYFKSVYAVISAVGGLDVGISGFEQGDSSFTSLYQNCLHLLCTFRSLTLLSGMTLKRCFTSDSVDS